MGCDSIDRAGRFLGREREVSGGDPAGDAMLQGCSSPGGCDVVCGEVEVEVIVRGQKRWLLRQDLASVTTSIIGTSSITDLNSLF